MKRAPFFVGSTKLPNNEVLLVLRGNKSIGGLEVTVGQLAQALPGIGLKSQIEVRSLEVDSPTREYFRMTNESATLLQLLQKIRSSQLVHFHAATMERWSIAEVVLSRLVGKPVVLTIHLPSEPQKRPRRRGQLVAALQMLIRSLILRAFHVTCLAPSTMAARLARHRLMGLTNVAAFYNGVPDHEGELKAVVPAANSHTIAFVGRLSQHKQPTVFIDAVANAYRQLPTLKAHIIGDGPELQRLKQQLENLQLPSKVITFHGHVHEPANILSQCDLLVLPSQSEGCPTVAMEAAALGIPTLTREGLDGMEEILPNCHFEVVATADGAAFGRSIIGILTNPKLASEMGRRSRQCFESNFSLEKTAQEYLALYHNLVKVPS